MDEWIEVWRTDYITAHIIKSRMEEEGIPVQLKYESIGLVYGLTVDGLGEVALKVPPESLEEARKILDKSLRRQD